MENGRDILFGLAGIFWGAVTIVQGWQSWRQNRFPLRSHASAYTIGKIHFPGDVLFGAAIAIGCSSYLLYFLWR
jgi:hypothetical protein